MLTEHWCPQHSSVPACLVLILLSEASDMLVSCLQLRQHEQYDGSDTYLVVAKFGALLNVQVASPQHYMLALRNHT